MQAPNDRPTDGTSRKGHPAPANAKTPAPAAKPASTPAPSAKPASTPAPSVKPATPEVKDVLKTQMPTGETGVRNQPGATLASASGGTSKAEDTSRAAGYVADLTKPNAAPPGPPIEKSPENFRGQTGNEPGKGPDRPTPNTTPPTPPTPPSPPTPDPTTPRPNRPPADVPPETDRPIRLPAPKGTIRPPKPEPKPEPKPAAKPDATGRIARAKDQAGKIGMAILMWLLGVPGGIILLYLIFR